MHRDSHLPNSRLLTDLLLHTHAHPRISFGVYYIYIWIIRSPAFTGHCILPFYSKYSSLSQRNVNALFSFRGRSVGMHVMSIAQPARALYRPHMLAGQPKDLSCPILNFKCISTTHLKDPRGSSPYDNILYIADSDYCRSCNATTAPECVWLWRKSFYKYICSVQ